MKELLLNRFKIELKNQPQKISYFTETDISDEKYYLARYKPTNLLKWNFFSDNNKQWLQRLKKEEIKNEEYIYMSLLIENSQHFDTISNFYELPISLLKKYLKEVFVEKLKKHFIIEPHREGVDLSLYKILNDANNYIRYDCIFNLFKDKHKIEIELTLAVGSTDTYIVQLKEEEIKKITNICSLKYCRNNILLRWDKNIIDNLPSYPINANAEIRKMLGKKTNPQRKYYENYYKRIDEFIKKLSQILNENFVIHTTFKSISEINLVSFEKNKMVFGKDREDYSTVNGMRDYGPYRIPEKSNEIKLLFIYPDTESANLLYKYLSRGYRHFPGLESYVGIPTNIFEKKINYENNLNSVPDKIFKELSENIYENLIAVVIMPFSKTTATEQDSEIYYKIKKVLLEKNIPSQFIHREKIFEENFHFSLPNIAIAMLAKCGGIPWKLAKFHYNQLTVGFNIFREKTDANNYIGAATFFDNEGIIREIKGFSGGSLDNIIKSLNDSIENYKASYSEVTRKVVIHFYKTVSNLEISKIKETINNLLGKDTIFAIIEINDSKTTNEICFDLDYESYMPQSGIYININRNEYLLFNNLRYWERPVNPINQEELPIKLRIYDPHNNFNHKELISQVYEFSRMYWKSLKQKAQPVTTIYAKLIANYLAKFKGQLPNSNVTKNRVWFI